MEPSLQPSGLVPPYRFITISVDDEQFRYHLFTQLSINYGRSNWEELFTKHQCSHDLQKVIDSGIAIVTADRKVNITLQGVNRLSTTALGVYYIVSLHSGEILVLPHACNI